MAHNEITVDVDSDAVFAVLADGWTYTNWVVGASHMRAVAADWPEVGSKLHHSSGVWPLLTSDDTEVTAMERGRRIALLARGRPFGEAAIEIELSDIDGGCRIVLRETPVAGPGKMLHNPLTEALLHRRNTETLERLAALCERRTEPK